MPGPLDAVTTVKDPTRYGALTMGGEQFTGIWTQRGPYRDAATAYLVRKFYQGSRFDSILDGLNREISLSLTDKRRPGSAVFNSATLPPALDFQSFKFVQNGAEVVKVLEDTAGTAATSVTLDVASTEGVNWRRSHPIMTIYYVIVTFTSAVPAFQNGQTYTFSGLTDHTELNGLTLTPSPTVPPGVTLTADQQILNGVSHFVWSTVSDTGTGVVTPISGTGPALLDISSSGSAPVIFNKSANAGKMRSQALGPTLYMADGVDAVKWLESGTVWQANTAVEPGTLINTGTAPGLTQMALGGILMSIASVASDGTYVTIYLEAATIPGNFANLVGIQVSFSGLTNATYLNGNSYAVYAIQSATLGIFTIRLTESVTAQTADTGTASTGSGFTGATAPTFSGAQFGVAQDAGQQWKCYGAAIKNWGLAAAAAAATIAAANGAQFWLPNDATPAGAILDSNGNVEVSGSLVSPHQTGPTYPTWLPFDAAAYAAGQGINTIDGSVYWQNQGPSGVWKASTTFGSANTQPNVILDSNNNWQLIGGAMGPTGSTEPTWNTTPTGTTTDGSATWICLGPGAPLTNTTASYSFSTHSIDESVSTAAPLTTIFGPISGLPLLPYLTVAGNFTPDTQIDQLWIFRTAQGQATAIYEDAVAADGLTGSFSYSEPGIPDSSANGNPALNALIAAPVNSANNPPPAGMTGPVYFLQRMWAFVGNVVYNSGGPDTTTGNGNTAWAPLSSFTYPGAVVRLLPVTVQNGGMLVFTTSGVHIILGTGTASNPFYTTQWCDKINLAGYDALDVLGTVIYLMEANRKVSSLTIEYPFNPQSGYLEIGFPIGDQFRKVTTGGISSALYTASGTFLSWNIADTGDTGMYVADGAVGWFRMANVPAPESGIFWSPRAAIAGGTSAVQSVETAPGVYTLLIGPAAGTTGPVLMRDQTGAVWDDNGTAFAAWDAKGVIEMCSTGAVAELAWIATKSMPLGKRPTLSVLMGEIAAVNGATWTLLQPTQQDPGDQPPSVSVYSDRYSAQQGAAVTKSDCVLIKFDYGAQSFADELLEFQIFGAKEEERKETAGGGT